MQQTAKHGGIAMVHCEDDCIIEHCVHKLYREGRQKAKNIREARPTLCEEAAVNRMLLLARRTDSPLYIVHVSSTEGVEAIAEAQAEARAGLRRGAAQLPRLLRRGLRQAERHDLPQLPRPEVARRTGPPCGRASDPGVLDVASSDDFTIPFASKISGKEVDNALGGHNGIETRMGYLFSEGVKKGRITSTGSSTSRRPRSRSSSASTRARAPSPSAATPTSS